MTVSLSWKEVQDILSAEMCCALNFTDEDGRNILDQASWGVSVQQNADDLVTFSVVTSQNYADPTEISTPTENGEEYCIDVNRITNATVQALFESSEGESATEMGEEAREHFTRPSVLRRLHSAGVSVLNVPQATTKTPFQEGGQWFDAAAWSMRIAFQKTAQDTFVKKVQQVEISGEVGEVDDIEITAPEEAEN